MGQARAAAVKRSDILGYLEAIPPGTNRRSHYKTLRKLWRWAFDLGHVESSRLAHVQGSDAHGLKDFSLMAIVGDVFGPAVAGVLVDEVRKVLGLESVK